jgi:hypothetical protein
MPPPPPKFWLQQSRLPCPASSTTHPTPEVVLDPTSWAPFCQHTRWRCTADGYEEMRHSWCRIVNEAIWIPTFLTSSAFSSSTILGGGKQAFTECRLQLQPTHVVAIDLTASDRELTAAATCCRDCGKEGENMVGDIDSLYGSSYYREPATHFVLPVFLAIPIDWSFKDTKRPMLNILHKKLQQKLQLHMLDSTKILGSGNFR